MDLTAFDTRKTAESGEELIINLPNGDPTDIVVTVIGEDSSKYRQYTLDQANKRAKLRAKDLTLDDLDRIVCEEAAVLIVGWKNLALNGEEKPYSHDAALEACKIPWFRDQVLAFARNRVNFLPKSAHK